MACTFSDIKNIAGQTVYPVYAQQGITSASYSSFLAFQNSMWTHYQSSGCSWWANRVTLWTSQLSSITNAYQLALKTAKITFAQQMHIECGCLGPVPSIVNPNASAKIIKSFNINYNDIKAAGETRRFTITGDDGAVFSLEITNEDSPKKYYNFKTNLFQASPTKLDSITISGGIYTGNIVFPTVTDADQYDIFLFFYHLVLLH